MIPFLSEDLIFPSAEQSTPRGIVAIGGDLSLDRLILAYRKGIFPWYNENDPIIWWSPDPRFILRCENLKVAKSMRPIFNKKKFRITYDQAFEEVIRACSHPRPNLPEDGTWLTEEMIASYIYLHKLGLAHSIEAWKGNELVGGLYGVSLGRAFFGESMFAKESNASKAAFITMVQKLQEYDFTWIDCQIHTNHLESLGGENVSRTDFLKMLDLALEQDTLRGNWGVLLQ
mgnify:CR=1 FL=1